MYTRREDEPHTDQDKYLPRAFNDLYKKITAQSYKISEDPILEKAIHSGIIELKSELDNKEYSITPSVASPEFAQFINFDIKCNLHLRTNKINSLNAYYFFYTSQFHLYNKNFNPTMLIFYFLFKTFPLSQKPVSIFFSEKGMCTFLLFNSPDNFKPLQSYSLTDLRSASTHSKNIVIINNYYELFSSWDEFAESSWIKESKNSKLDFQVTYKTQVINDFIKNNDKLLIQANKFYHEIKKTIEFENFTTFIAQNKIEIKLEEKKPLPEDPQLMLSKEIKKYEKFSPVEYHKRLAAVKKDLLLLKLNENIKKCMRNHEDLINTYIQQSTYALQKNNAPTTEENLNTFTIKQFQTLYSNFIHNNNIEERKTIIKALQNITNKYNPLLNQSFEKLQTSILETRQSSASEFKKIQEEFYKSHKDFSDKLNTMKTLHKEAELKQNKKLKRVTLFTKNQSIGKYSEQLTTLGKLVNKSSEKDLENIKTYIITLEKDLKIIDDKIKILQQILQPQESKKTPSKAPLQNKVEDKKLNVTISPAPLINHIVEIVEDEEDDSLKNLQKNRRTKTKKKKKKSKIAKTLAEEKSLTTTNVIPIPKNEITTNSTPLPLVESVLEKSVTTTIITPPNTVDSFPINLLLAMSNLLENKPLIIPTASESTSSLKNLSLFKSNMVLAPSESKNIPVDFTPYSYGLLIRCKNNKYLNSFANKIPKSIRTFSASKELRAQPHISLFYFENLQLNDPSTREKLHLDLKKLFSITPLPSKLDFTHIGAFGVDHNENKFLALEIKMDEQLNKIYESCLALFKKHNILIPNKFDFKPHVTIGYSTIPIEQSQLNMIDPTLSQLHIELDIAVFNRKLPSVKGQQVRPEVLQTFTLKIEENLLQNCKM